MKQNKTWIIPLLLIIAMTPVFAEQIPINGNTGTYTITGTAPTTNGPITRIFNNDYDLPGESAYAATGWTAPSASNPIIVDINLNGESWILEQYDFIVVDAGTEQYYYEPSSWTWWGSNDGNTYTQIANVSGYSGNVWNVSNAVTGASEYEYLRWNITAIDTAGPAPDGTLYVEELFLYGTQVVNTPPQLVNFTKGFDRINSNQHAGYSLRIGEAVTPSQHVALQYFDADGDSCGDGSSSSFNVKMERSPDNNTWYNAGFELGSFSCGYLNPGANLPASDHQKNTYMRAVMAVRDAKGASSGWTTTPSWYVSNSPPTISNQQITQEETTLDLTYNYNDFDGDPEANTQYEWYSVTNTDSEIDSFTSNINSASTLSGTPADASDANTSTYWRVRAESTNGGANLYYTYDYDPTWTESLEFAAIVEKGGSIATQRFRIYAYNQTTSNWDVVKEEYHDTMESGTIIQSANIGEYVTENEQLQIRVEYISTSGGYSSRIMNFYSAHLANNPSTILRSTEQNPSLNEFSDKDLAYVKVTPQDTEEYGETYTVYGGYLELCAPNWQCSNYVCQTNDTATCTEVTDTNSCGENYTGDMSEFTIQCSYGTFPESTSSTTTAEPEEEETNETTYIPPVQIREETSSSGSTLSIGGISTEGIQEWFNDLWSKIRGVFIQ